MKTPIQLSVRSLSPSTVVPFGARRLCPRELRLLPKVATPVIPRTSDPGEPMEFPEFDCIRASLEIDRAEVREGWFMKALDAADHHQIHYATFIFAQVLLHCFRAPFFMVYTLSHKRLLPRAVSAFSYGNLHFKAQRRPRPRCTGEHLKTEWQL